MHAVPSGWIEQRGEHRVRRSRRRSLVQAWVWIGIAGCSQSQAGIVPQETEGHRVAAAEDVSKPPAPAARRPQRLASVAILGDELLWTLGPESRAATVAVSPLADDPRYSQTLGRWPAEVRRLSKNPADLLAADPDLAIVATFTDTQYRAAIAEAIPMFELRGFTGFAGYEDNVMRLAAALGQIEAGERLRNEFRQRINAIEARRASGPAPTCLAWAHGSVAGAETTLHDATVAAGCTNIPAEAGLQGHRRVDAEQIVAWDPDFIIISCRDATTCEFAATQFGERPGFAGLRAVENRRVISIPGPLLSTTGAGMAELASRIQDGLRQGSGESSGIDVRALAPVSSSSPPQHCGPQE